MKTEEMMVWLIVVLVVWLIPLGVYAIERKALKQAWQKIVMPFTRQSFRFSC